MKKNSKVEKKSGHVKSYSRISNSVKKGSEIVKVKSEAADEDKKLDLLDSEDFVSLEQAKEYWLLGEWGRLVAYDLEFLREHPDRGHFILLIGNAYQQLGYLDKGRDYIYLALKWGCSKHEMGVILVSTVCHAFERISVLRGSQNKMPQLFEQKKIYTEADITKHYQYRIEKNLFSKKRGFRFSNQNYNNLNQNQQHNFAKSHALSIYRSDAVYSFIPKNACSTLRTTIAIDNGCIKDKSDFNWIHQNNNTFEASLSELVKAKYTFVVLRCPFSRLVSVYLDKFVSRDPNIWRYIDMYNSISLDDKNISLEDVTFEFFVKSLLLPRVRIGNHHWRPQVDFLLYDKYDDYFSLENFSLAVSTLKNRIDLDVIDARPLTKHAINDYNFNNFNKPFLLKPFGLLKGKLNGVLPKPRAMYNNELIRIVKKVYKDDIYLYKSLWGDKDLMFN